MHRSANARTRAILRRLFASCLLLAPLHLAGAEPSHGVHGMVLFGDRDGLYAAHLPMFHAPHDTQVVLRVGFADPKLEQDLRARLDGKTALWTLEPERFALRGLAPGAATPVRSFKARVVEGHFERGGTGRVPEATLRVEQVVLYRPLSAQPSVRDASTYVPVGRFLVKLVDSRPDFDHIVRLMQPAPGPVEVPKQGVEDDAAALARRTAYAGTIYYETADLR